MVADSALLAQSSARLARIDRVIAPLVVPADAHLLEVGAAVGWTTEAHVDPETMRASWGKLHQFDLYPAWTGDPIGLDALVDAWAKRIRAGHPGPDSQAMVTWPSRDVDAARVFRAHGLTPGLTGAVRLHPTVTPGRSRETPSGITVRPAHPGDLDDVVELFMEEMQYSAGLDPGTIRASTRPAGRAMLADAIEADWVWVAEVDAAVCGLLRATRPDNATFSRPALPTPSNWVVLLAVTAEHRGRGVGTALADAAHEAFTAAGVRATVLIYTTLNPLSVPFWSRQGYRPLWSVWSAWPAYAVT